MRQIRCFWRMTNLRYARLTAALAFDLQHRMFSP